MKIKDYLKELSLVILGVLIALLIDNYREDIKEQQIVESYLDIVVEDLNFDIQNLNYQLHRDSVYAEKLQVLSDILTTNKDLPSIKFGLSSWTTQTQRPYQNLSEWDSLDFYIMQLYDNNEYKTRKIGFSTIANSNLSHRIDKNILQKITIYYTTDSEYLDFLTDIDSKCQWNAIAWLNQYQGTFKNFILRNDFNSTLLRNEVSGRYSTTLSEMSVKKSMIDKAKELLKELERS